VVLVPLESAVGRVLAEDVLAQDPLPPFRASTMDGYALQAEDMPGEYPVIGEVMAGQVANFVVTPKTVARITTGAAVPEGANAVIKVESTEVLPERDAQGRQVVRFLCGTAAGKCIRPIGSDIAVGQVVVTAGTRVGPVECGLLATVGVTRVATYAPPRVAVLSTGDELVLADEKPGPGQIRDSNKPMLLAAIQEYGRGTWAGIDVGIAKDTKEDLEAKFKDALGKADVILTSGGVSMGELDLMQPLLESYGKIHFGRLLMKPGKPLTFATIDVPDETHQGGQRRVLVFGLPGNPVSSLVTFQLVALPALRKMAGWQQPNLRRIKAKLASDLALDPERPEYHRCMLQWIKNEEGEGGCFLAHSTGEQSSSRLLSMRTADALLCLPQREGVLTKETFVDALLIGTLEYSHT